MPTDTEIFEDPTPRINLSTSDDIRREMARVYRETRFNKILPNNGTKLVYMLINILKAYEVTEIEKRLTDLEKTHLKGDKWPRFPALKNLKKSYCPKQNRHISSGGRIVNGEHAMA